MDFEQFLAELIAQRASLQDDLEKNAAISLVEKRDMNDEESKRHAEIEAKLASKDGEIAKIQKIVDSRKACPKPPKQIEKNFDQGEKTAPAFRYRHGKLRAFKDDEKAYRFGKWFAGVVLGMEGHRQWCIDAGMEVRGTSPLTTTNNTLGGALVIPEFEQTIIDLREQYGIARQKCRIVPMASDTKTVPRRTGGVTAYFVSENSEVTASDKSWDQVTLTARKLGALCKYSSEIDEDAMVSIGDDLANEIAYAFAVKEDTCLFLGTGTSTYGGISGIITELAAGSEVTATTTHTAFSTLTLGDFESMIGKLPEYNGIRPEWYISKAGWAASMMRLADAAGGNTTENIVGGVPQRTFLGYPVNFVQCLNSTLTAQTSTEGICYFGDMSMTASFGSRRGMTLKVSQDRYLEYDQIGILGTERFDIVVHGKGDASNPGPMLQLLTPSG